MTRARHDIPLPKRTIRAIYDFDSLKPGASIHVKTHQERVNILNSFRYWAANVRKINAKAVSRAVGPDDPDGIGFRVWFVSEAPKQKVGEI